MIGVLGSTSLDTPNWTASSAAAEVTQRLTTRPCKLAKLSISLGAKEAVVSPDKAKAEVKAKAKAEERAWLSDVRRLNMLCVTAELEQVLAESAGSGIALGDGWLRLSTVRNVVLRALRK